MEIQTVKIIPIGWLVNGYYHVRDSENKNANRIRAWEAAGGVIEPADPPPTPPTDAELIDMAGPVLVAFIKAWARHQDIPLAQIKNAIVAEM